MLRIDFGTSLGDLSQSEKLSEIKPPLLSQGPQSLNLIEKRLVDN